MARAWWSHADWDGRVNGVMHIRGLAARAGLRPSTVRRADPSGLWAAGGRRLEIDGWADPILVDGHRQVRYDDYRCSTPGRSGREGASLRWHGPVTEPGPSDETPAGDNTKKWGELIDSPPIPIPYN